MAIEGLIAEKHRLMEELLRQTAGMQRALLSNDLDVFDQELAARAGVFERMRLVDEKLKGQATPQDELWMKQLEMIGSTDREIMQMIAVHKAAITKEVETSGSTKASLLAENYVEPKGHRIQVRG